MLILFDLCVLIISSWILIRALKKIYYGCYSMLHFCVAIFYFMQILPIVIGYFGNLEKIEKYYEYMYYAMVDENVSYIYNVFVLVGIIVLSYYADKIARKNNKNPLLVIDWGNKRQLLVGIAAICMLLPIVAAFFAPNPQVYLKFSYFYMNEYSKTGTEYLYHRYVMRIITYLSFAGIMFFYYGAKKYRKPYTYFALILITWINGKRTLMVFMLAGILIIDFLKWNRQSRKYIKMLVYKAFLFVGIIIAYYLIYNNKTGKSDFADEYLLYSTYFGRLCNVKVAIYDMLNQGKMLDYSCQTLLYNLLFFVPRMFWAGKPYPYYRYFTSYTYFGVSDKLIPGMQFQVNIWSEFISNIGVIGYILSLVFVIMVVKKSEKSNNSVTLLAGSVFVFLYMMYGFEHIVQISYIIWLASIIWSYVRRKIRISK